MADVSQSQALSSAGEVGADPSARVSEFARAWARHEPQRAVDWLARFPELATDEKYVRDVALEEFYQRTKAGDPLDVAVFAAGFGSFADDVRQVLSVHLGLQHFAGVKELAGPISWPAPGETYGRFKIVKLLGSGGFARVYLATEAITGGRSIVLKIGRGDADEGKILGRLLHPHIIPLLFVEHDPASDMHLIVMPFLGEVTLELLAKTIRSPRSIPRRCDVLVELLAQISTPPETPRFVPDPSYRIDPRDSYVRGVARIVKHLADALAYAHELKIVHGDVKPSNVLLGFSGSPMLLDFNLSSDGARFPWQLGGTLPYMPPELLRLVAHPQPLSEFTPAPSGDIYSLAVVAYELLAGRLPFGESGPKSTTEGLADSAAKQLALIEGGLLRLDRFNPAVDSTLQNLFERCLSPAPAARPTAREVATQLHAWNSPAAHMRRTAQRYRRSLWTAGLCLSLATAAAATWQLNREPYVTRELRAGAAALSSNDFVSARQHAEAALAIEPDNWRAMATRSDALIRAGLFERAIDQFTAIPESIRPAAIDARIGYCFTTLKQHALAIRSYDIARRKGYQPPWMLTDLGFSLAQRVDSEQARNFFSEALKLDPRLQVAYFHRASLTLRQGPASFAGLDQAFADAQAALAIEPHVIELQLLMLGLWAARTEDSEQKQQQMEQHLRIALALGVEPEKLRARSFFKQITNAERILSEPFTPITAQPMPFVLPPPLESWL